MSLNINDILIIETNFKVIGKPSSTKTRFKGIITPESIFGGETYHINKSYFDYTSRIDAKDEIELNNNHLINIKDDSDYFGYTSRLIDKGNFTFTNNGFLKTQETINNFKKENKKLILRKGSVVYEIIISYKNLETAFKNKMYCQSDYALKTHLLMPKLAKILKLDINNIIYWQDYHNKKADGEVHPHIHINFFEKFKTRKDGQDKFTKTELKQIKRECIKQFILENNFDKKILKENIIKNIDISKKELKEKIKTFDYKIINEIEKLLNVIPDNGRLQYNSIHIKPYRKLIDKVVAKILSKDEFKNIIDDFKIKLDEYDKLYKNEIKTSLTNIKEIELKKINTIMANEILKLKKDLKNYKLNLSNTKTKLNKNNYKVIKENYSKINNNISYYCNNRIKELNDEFLKFLQDLEKENSSILKI